MPSDCKTNDNNNNNNNNIMEALIIMESIFLQNMDSDTINYCGCGLTAMYLKLCMQVLNTYI